MTPVLELAGVSKAYGALRPLRIRELAVHRGEAVALVGLDAPAAEILVNLIMGATLPDEGRIVAFGRETSTVADSTEWLALADRFGLVGHRAVLLDALSVVQNLALPLTLDIEPPPPGIRDRAVALARQVALPEAAWDRPVGALDAPGRVRVHLARALALDPGVLILEHASAGLDADRRAEIGSLIREVASARGPAILALTRDEVFAEAVATRVLRHDPRTGACAAPRGWRFW